MSPVLRVTSAHASEISLHEYATEASTLGFPPGQYPQKIATSLGNGREFVMSEDMGDYVVYRQALGCVFLKVYND